jgi:SNF2 family DNA or RNA helicase
MTSSLYAYQAAVLPQMERGEPTYLGFDPGLGKSRTALEAAKRRKVRRLLVICPASGRYVWEKECRLWWPEMPFRIVQGIGYLPHLRNVKGIVLVTYGLLSQKDSPYAATVAKGPAFDMTIVDEASAVKNAGANRTRAILKTMLPKLGYVVPMSGTPAPNHAGELYPILKAIYPQAIMQGSTPMAQWQFEDAFCKVVSKRFGMGRDIRVIEGSKNLPELRRRLQGFMVRVRKEDVMKDLPPLRWDVVPVQAKAGAAVPVPTLPALGKMSDEEFLKYLAGASGDEHVMRLRRLLGLAKLEAAIEYIQDFIDNLPLNRKLLVFAHHKEVIAGLAAGLAASSPAVLTGGSSANDRKVSIDRFLTEDSCRVFIGNIAAAGTGITLVGPTCKCSDVIFVESTYSVGDNHQAACRVHRIGQQDAVVVRMLAAHGTIDDRIMDILARKAQDFEALFGGA